MTDCKESNTEIAVLRERLDAAERALVVAKQEQDRRMQEQDREHRQLERMVIAIIAAVVTYLIMFFTYRGANGPGHP